MTHIRGKVDWWESSFDSYESNSGELILRLSGGTTRKMENWGEDTVATFEHLKELRLEKGDEIRVATWGGRSRSEWFCDVERI